MAVSCKAYPKLSRIQCESAAVADCCRGGLLVEYPHFKAISFQLVSIRLDVIET